MVASFAPGAGNGEIIRFFGVVSGKKSFFFELFGTLCAPPILTFSEDPVVPAGSDLIGRRPDLVGVRLAER